MQRYNIFNPEADYVFGDKCIKFPDQKLFLKTINIILDADTYVKKKRSTKSGKLFDSIE